MTTPHRLIRLRSGTLPLELLTSFETSLPNLATRKREFYFDASPSGKLTAGLSKIRTGEQYGRFIIKSNEEIVLEN